MKRDAPHPLLMLSGLAIAVGLFVISQRTNLLPRPLAIAVAIGFVVVFRWLARRSAAMNRAKHQQELEDLRHTSVFGLDK